MDSQLYSQAHPSVNEQYTVPSSRIIQQGVDGNQQGERIEGDAAAVPMVASHHNMILLQSTPRVVLPGILPNDIVTTGNGDAIEQEIPSSMVDSYTAVNPQQMQPILMSYPSGVIQQTETLPGEELPSSNRFVNTLVGRISKLLRDEKRPMMLEEIVTRITPFFSELRKMDGTRYKGNILKAVNGALSSTGIFMRLDNMKWVIREDELEAYEQRAQKKLETKGKRKRDVPAGNTEEEKPAKRRYTKRRDRKQAIIAMLTSISDLQHAQNLERNAIYSQNPFENLTGLEDAEALRKKLGDQRFTLCMQLYAYFEDLFKVATGDVKIDLQRVVNTGSGINDKRLIQLLMDIDDIKKRHHSITCL
ncbi:hypothetical protein WA577_001931 [Blastocystis sp. JDR]